MEGNYRLETSASGISWLRFPFLESKGPFRALFSCRLGGISPAPFDSLNVGFNVPDDPNFVRENRRLAYEAMGINPAKVASPLQVHGYKISYVQKRDFGSGTWDAFSAFRGYDILASRVPGATLITFYADCAPVYVVDPRLNTIALGHAGWKGTAVRVPRYAVQGIERKYGSIPPDLWGLVGPTIGPCCYQVDSVVREGFRRHFGDYDDLFTPDGPDRWKLNLWEANRRALIETGIPEEQVQVAGICTCCRQDLFYSYRGSGGRCGRNMAVLSLDY